MAQRKESLGHGDGLPDDLSPTELEFLVKINPALKKKVDLYNQLRAKEMELKARSEGGFSQDEPMIFVRQVLGLRPTAAAKSYGITEGITKQQITILEALRDHKRVAVPAGHGVGKTYLMAVVTLWFLYGKEDRIVVTTAPNQTLVEQQLWQEIRSLHTRAKVKLPGRLLTTRVDVQPGWYALGMATDEPERFRGFHGKGGTLIIFDEATGIAESLYDEAESMIVGSKDRMVLIGNPTNNSSKFKKCCDSGMWHVISLDAREHPNVVHNDPDIIPGAVTTARIDDWLEMYGGPESPGFLVRAAGRWAAMSDETLISYDWIIDGQQWDEREKARKAKEGVGFETEEEMQRGAALGVDIAGAGSDLCVCWEIMGGRAKVLWHTQHRDVMETAGRITKTIRDGRGKYLALAIDDTGIGNGVSSRVIEVQSQTSKGSLLTSENMDPLPMCGIIRVNFGASPTVLQKWAVTRFWRIKDEMWWNTREALRNKLLGLPDENELRAYAFPRGNSLLSQLSAPIYVLDSAGNIHVYDKYSESHERAKVLPVKSPDIAHGLILAWHAYRTLRAEKFAEPAREPTEFRRRYYAKKMWEEHTNPELKKNEEADMALDYPDIYDFL